MNGQLVLPLELPGALGREDFLVGPGNSQAVGFIDAWPDWPQPAAALYGPPAAGKSHLAAIWAARTGASVIAASALEQGIPDGPLVVEDVAAGTGQALLFALLERASPLLLTAAAAPARWPEDFGFTLPDLVSRCRALLGFALWAPDEALLMALAAKLFADRQVSVPEAAISHMIHSLERSPAAVRDFVARADAQALAEKRPINLNLIKGLLTGPVPPAGS
jgi:chromosomal replication initiation ATPase DnaA